MFRPSSHALNAVSSWLNGSGVAQVSMYAGNIVQFHSTIEQMKTIFESSCDSYEHADSKDVHVACSNVRIPTSLKDHVEHVTINDASGFSRKNPSRKRPARRDVEPDKHSIRGMSRHAKRAVSGLARCAQSWTPECIRGKSSLARRPPQIPSLNTEQNSIKSHSTPAQHQTTPSASTATPISTTKPI